jgi:HIP---CoA ligase
VTIPSITSLLSADRATGISLLWGDSKLGGHDIRHLVDVLALGFDEQPGQRVVIIASNTPALVVGMFAAWQAGAVAVPLSSRLRRYDLARVFADAEPRIVVSVDSQAGFPIAGVVSELGSSVPSLERQFVVDGLGRIEAEHSFAPRQGSTSLPEAAATVLYTSGSTGTPKGAVLSHAYSLQAAQSFQEVLGIYAERPTAYVVPASHMFGYATLLASIRAGAPAVLIDTPGPAGALPVAVARHRVGVLHGSPTLFAGLLQSGLSLPIDAGFVAGSRCPPELIAEWESRGTRLLNQYGMTELGAVTACRLDDASEIRLHTVGRALPSFEIRTAGNTLDGAPSEIQVRGQHVWPTLYGRDWRPDEMGEGGWLHTGDLGFVDSGGNVRIAGRAKDVVQVGGFSVFPAEVEGFLLCHSSVSAAAVLGIPHSVHGEALVAFVVPKGENPPTPRELTGFCRAGIAGYKVPTAFHLLATLPLLPSGKIDKQALAQSVSQE